MKTYHNVLLIILLLCVGNDFCKGKNFTVSDITYLPTDRSATDSPVLDSNQEMCALIKLPFPRVDETVISGDQIYKKEYHGNEWYIYMPPETFKFFIKYPGYEDLEIDLSKKFPKGVESGKTYKVTIPNPSELTPIETKQNNQISSTSNNYSSNGSSVSNSSWNSTPFHTNVVGKKESPISKDDFYIQVGYNVLGLSGLNVAAGGYISNINIEANYLMGLSKSENIYWNHTSGDTMPISAQYLPMGCNLKFGYGIKLADRFRLTPQVGAQYIVLQEKSNRKVANNANAIGLPIGVKIDFAIINHFGMSFKPSYNISITQSEGYKVLSDVSSKIKGYSDGIGLNISLFCNF